MITIIGGAGFIGTRLSTRLHANGYRFSILDKTRSRSFPDHTTIADVRDVDSLANIPNDTSAIVNLAAEHRDDVRPRSLYDEVNVAGAQHICSVARQKRIKKIIFTSSVAVYGFSPSGTDESGEINYFNDYGRTKWEAEKVYRVWQSEDPGHRTLVIIRPTVVFGEQNRGNVYNLLRQIAAGRFLMVGSGRNIKSMAYVENVAAFLEYSLTAFTAGTHTYNYVDTPDYDMNGLVRAVRRILGKSAVTGLHVPYPLGYLGGRLFDLVSVVSGRSLPVSSIRVKKFCADTHFASSARQTGFTPPVSLQAGLERTVRYEFMEDHQGESLFYTE